MVVTAISPWIVASDADGLLSFLTDVLGAQEVGRAPGPDGRVGHAETVVGGTTLVVMDAHEGWTPQPTLLRVRVDDLEVVVAATEAAGGRVVTPPTPLPQGVVGARVLDPWGNLWWLEQQVDDVPVDELLRRLSDADAVTVVAAYESSLDTEMRRRA
ncbi:glyoxalase/bleomycin resistance/extradiol dioxygenase family protein [Nocardioides sp.]|uniref:VOC family protein n=1 Tax=Nocardioides sp. TaxID=35761 RepID=UPI002716DFB0|nr:VOC family protein [Nocardioides sp.]MDO9456693.1 VOC family protein [Nocardioides sp.]